ncbi:uncharacterized protein LOC130049408 isoform X2 [Ostrea edulis]|uniref:uncharacterized protein LOC130049408 isoform X2 n=1 Tax=Ostrea edulis TaxID=37623 RepID=UPI0024AF825D|nr:uncharacterized protein LOC130049408 isoform X2 [Ostrea edulis]
MGVHYNLRSKRKRSHPSDQRAEYTDLTDQSNTNEEGHDENTTDHMPVSYKWSRHTVYQSYMNVELASLIELTHWNSNNILKGNIR